VDQAVILSAVRTPNWKISGRACIAFPRHKLGAKVVASPCGVRALSQARWMKSSWVMLCQAGLGQNPRGKRAWAADWTRASRP